MYDFWFHDNLSSSLCLKVIKIGNMERNLAIIKLDLMKKISKTLNSSQGEQVSI